MAHYQSVSMLNRAGPNGHRHRKSASWRNIFLGFDLWNAVREKSKRDGPVREFNLSFAEAGRFV